MKNFFLSLLLFSLFLISFNLRAQKQKKSSATAKGLLWEVSGKGLTKPSYIFGTFHFLNEDYLNSLKGWKEKFDQCNVVVGEIIIDSAELISLAPEKAMKDTTLDKLMTPEEYKLTKDFLKEVSGMDLAMFNSFKPMVVSSFLAMYSWAKAKPEDFNPQKLTMDVYFQKLAEKEKKKVEALETTAQQFDWLFNKISLERQKSMLVDFVKDKGKSMQELLKMDKCYREQDLDCLKTFLYANKSYTKEELDLLVYKRNTSWAIELPLIMVKNPAFIAVGAAHLPGEKGLINLLRKQGYTVKAITMQ